MGFIFDYYSTFAYKLAQKMKKFNIMCRQKNIYNLLSASTSWKKSDKQWEAWGPERYDSAGEEVLREM